MGPFKCPDCGTWWAGVQHRCHEPRILPGAQDDPPFRPGLGTIRVSPGATDTGNTTSAPWCDTCRGWHVPGHGACTGTWSAS